MSARKRPRRPTRHKAGQPKSGNTAGEDVFGRATPRRAGGRKPAPGKPGATARTAVQRRRRRTKISLMLAAALVLAVLGAVAFRGGSADPASSTQPAAFDLPALNGDTRVALADYRGTPVVVNFFASWCTACDFELPGFAKVSRELKGKVRFVGVNALETGDRNLMPRRHHITWWPLARDVGGANGSGLHDALGGGNSMPLTAFYDRDGKLLGVDRAALPEDALRQRLADLYGV